MIYDFFSMHFLHLQKLKGFNAYHQLFCFYIHRFYISKSFQRKIVNIFLPIIFSICFGCSKNCLIVQPRRHSTEKRGDLV